MTASPGKWYSSIDMKILKLIKIVEHEIFNTHCIKCYGLKIDVSLTQTTTIN